MSICIISFIIYKQTINVQCPFTHKITTYLRFSPFYIQCYEMRFIHLASKLYTVVNILFWLSCHIKWVIIHIMRRNMLILLLQGHTMTLCTTFPQMSLWPWRDPHNLYLKHLMTKYSSSSTGCDHPLWAVSFHYTASLNPTQSTCYNTLLERTCNSLFHLDQVYMMGR